MLLAIIECVHFFQIPSLNAVAIAVHVDFSAVVNLNALQCYDPVH